VHIPLLTDLAAIAAIGVLVTVVLSRLRLPAVAGLLLAGALCGPAGLGIVSDTDAIEVLAEVGVVLLLFSIGLEFSLARLRAIFRQVAVGGLAQVTLTALATFGVARALGIGAAAATLLGFIFALSSTAIVLRGLAERRELDAPHGRFIVGALIFQDLCVVPMLIVVPLLAPGAGTQGVVAAVALALGKAAGVFVVTVVLARALVPRVFAWVASARSREVFLLAVLAVCIGTAWLTSLVGLSLALGAFLGGMVVADTEYGHRATSDVLPLRDAFVSLFFVSLGMLFDVREVLERPGVVALLTLAFVFGKGFLATLSAMTMRFPARVAWLAGAGLAQFGEFGFVLARQGQASGVIDAATLQPVLTAGILSMFLTPLAVRVAPHVTAGERLLGPLQRLIGVRSIDEPGEAPALEGHVVIAGYGVAGQVLSRALAAVGVKYVVLELNADTARKARAAGEPVFYADATSVEALGHARLAAARALVLVMNDPQAVRRVLDAAKREAPGVPVLLRAHYLAEAPALLDLGATDVVAEEVEGAVEMLVRVLGALETPRNLIEERVREARAATQTTERKLTMRRRSFAEVPALAQLKVEHFVVTAGSEAAGKSLAGLSLRQRTGAQVVRLERGGKPFEVVDPALPLEVGDVVYVSGTGEAMRATMALFSAVIPLSPESGRGPG